jgi:hypothetical protein
MIIEVKNKDIFIPTYGGNDKQPDGEQIKVHHRFLLPGERKKYIYTQPIKVNKLEGTVDGTVEAVQDEKGICEAIITGIDNLEIKCGNKTVKVNTVEKMYNTSGVPKALVSEIEVNMLLASPVVDASFLEKPSV